MKRRPIWPVIAIPVSLSGWGAAVWFVHGPEQLPDRAWQAFCVFLFLLVLVGATCLVHLIIGAIWDFPMLHREAARDRRATRGQCVGCGYPLTGNLSGICPECGLHKGEIPHNDDPRYSKTRPIVRWAITLAVVSLMAIILMSIS